MKKSKMILLFMLAMLIVVAGTAKAQDGSEYLLWEKTPDYSLFSFDISSDETKIVVTGSYNNDESYVLKAYDILTGNEIFSKPLTTRPTSTARFTSDNKYLLIYNEQSIDFYDPNTYNIVKTFTRGGISFSADNKIFSKTEDNYVFRIYNSDTFEPIFEGNLTKPASDEIGSYEAFFTPNGKYLITNVTTYKEGHYSERKTVQEIYDAKTFLKIDRTINCLKGYGPFSNNGLCVKTYSKGGFSDPQIAGFRIYDYEKDSLIWEQETKKYANLIFLKTKNYLISKYDTYESGNPEMKVFTTWNLETLARDKDVFCKNKANSKISNADKYLVAHNGVTICLYDFESMFERYVSINEPNKSIEININIQSDSNLIKFSNLSSDIVNITIYDLSGNLIDIIYNGNSISNTLEFNTSSLSKGIYLVRIDTDQDSITKKIIIE